MKYNFADKQIELMKKMNIPFDFMQDLSDDEFFQLDDIVSDYLITHCFDGDYNIRQEGVICEDILEMLNND